MRIGMRVRVMSMIAVLQSMCEGFRIARGHCFSLSTLLAFYRGRPCESLVIQRDRRAEHRKPIRIFVRMITRSSQISLYHILLNNIHRARALNNVATASNVIISLTSRIHPIPGDTRRDSSHDDACNLFS
jgi:hypothetical protein